MLTVINAINLPQKTQKQREDQYNNSVFLCIQWQQNTINLISDYSFRFESLSSQIIIFND